LRGVDVAEKGADDEDEEEDKEREDGGRTRPPAHYHKSMVLTPAGARRVFFHEKYRHV
jgi:hypothetical protein